MKAKLEAAGVSLLSWPSISPGLHPIEDPQCPQKQLLEDLRFDTKSASRDAKDTTIREMKLIWQRELGFTAIVEEVGSTAEYIHPALLARQHHGNNNLNA